MHAEQPLTPLADPSSASADQLRAAWGPFVGEAGTFEVNGNEITMQAAVSKNPSAMTRGAVSETSSGRLAEAVLEGQHMVGKRIVVASMAIVKKLRSGEDPLAPKSPLLSAMTRLVWLVNHFVDPYHHRMEEESSTPRDFPPGSPTGSREPGPRCRTTTRT